jgi:muramoyltetrapeptide carboxypeptidase
MDGDRMIPDKLNYGDEIRVIAPSRSLSIIYEDVYKNALDTLTEMGFKVSFSKNSRELDEANSSSIESRVSDLHEAFADKNVKAILTCIGGFNVNQILDYINYSLIQNNPKILCGYSDITALSNAIYAKTGLVTYNGTHFSTFGFDKDKEYTIQYFEKCLMQNNQFVISPSNKSKKYNPVVQGSCEGKIIGGNLCTLNLLQGTAYMPDLNDKIICGKYFSVEFDRNLQSLIHASGFSGVKGIVLGSFDDSCNLDLQIINRIVKGKKQLQSVPVVFNVDFGHVFPLITFPIGGTVKLDVSGDNAHIEIIKH